MELDKETQEKIQELQALEQNLQSLLMQKQAFQMESNETENALNEISKAKEDVFKLIGQIMIKADKESLEHELKHKQELLSIRLKSIEKQETNLSEGLEELKSEIMKKINK